VSEPRSIPELDERVRQADAFFRVRMERHSRDGWRVLWRAFDDCRRGWRWRKERKDPDFIGPSMDHYVDHGWAHWEEVYAFLPLLILSLEGRGDETREVLRNAGEYLVLMFAAYLHDYGQLCPAHFHADFLRDATESGRTRGLQVPEEAKKRFSLILEKSREWKLDLSVLFPHELREWHALVGAWRILSGRGSPFSQAWLQEPVAAVVALHRKDTDKSEARDRQLEWPDSPEACLPVRTGLLASIIALADSCMIGRARVEEAQQHITAVRGRLGQLLRSALEASDAAAVRPLAEDLARQDRHHILHAAIERVACVPGGICILPAHSDLGIRTWLKGTEQWMEVAVPDDVAGGSPPHMRTEPRRGLLKEAVRSIRDEIDGRPKRGGKSVREAVRSQEHPLPGNAGRDQGVPCCGTAGQGLADQRGQAGPSPCGLPPACGG